MGNQGFMRLYLQNQGRIYGFILSMVPDWSDADDLLQETATVLWSKFDRFEPGTDFGAWALKIARFEVLNFFKRNDPQKLQFREQTLKLIAPQFEKAMMQQDERRDALLHCIASLNQRDRQVLEMRYEMGASIRSIAQKISRSADTVYKSLNRIHRRLLFCVRTTLAKEEMI